MTTKWKKVANVCAVALWATGVLAAQPARAADSPPAAPETPSATQDDSSPAPDSEQAPPAPETAPAQPRVNVAQELDRANRLASAGALSRSIPHYETVLKAAPDSSLQAYFNLAEVYRLKNQCDKSVLLYSIYLSREADEANRQDARSALGECLKGRPNGKLSIQVLPDVGARVLLGGYSLGQGSGVENLQLLSGGYTLEVLADEYIPHNAQVSVRADETLEHQVALEKKLFHGKLKLHVNQPGATVRIEPKTLDSRRADTQNVTLQTPADEPLRLATGTYFIEVTKPNFNRWIRNVQVRRDEQTDVDIRLSPALPDAIQPR